MTVPLLKSDHFSDKRIHISDGAAVQNHLTLPVIAWMETAEWFLSAPVMAEIQEGAEAAPSMARRTEVSARLDELLRAHGGLILDCPGVNETSGRGKG
jgi:hypothetical protein